MTMESLCCPAIISIGTTGVRAKNLYESHSRAIRRYSRKPRNWWEKCAARSLMEQRMHATGAAADDENGEGRFAGDRSGREAGHSGPGICVDPGVGMVDRPRTRGALATLARRLGPPGSGPLPG